MKANSRICCSGNIKLSHIKLKSVDSVKTHGFAIYKKLTFDICNQELRKLAINHEIQEEQEHRS